MTWAYSPSYGKPLSVPQGIIGLLTRIGMNVHLAHPEGYNLSSDVIKQAEIQAKESSGHFILSDSMEEAYQNADVVYSKSWAPMHIMQKRTELLMKNKDRELKELEQEGLSYNAKYKNWECTQKLMDQTRNGSALYMHCLPADISGISCEHGEVEKEVFEKYRIPTYIEASFKPYIIASMILNNRFISPDKIITSCYNQAQKLRIT